MTLDVNIARERGLLGSSSRVQTRTPVAKERIACDFVDRYYWLQLSELLRFAWRLERRAPDLPVLLVSNEPSAACTCCTRESDCDKLESWAVVKIAGYSRAVGQSRCKGRVRIGTVEGKLRGGGPGNRTRPPAWESNPAVLVEQLVDELDAVVGARAVDDLHAFGRDERRNRDAHVLKLHGTCDSQRGLGSDSLADRACAVVCRGNGRGESEREE